MASVEPSAAALQGLRIDGLHAGEHRSLPGREGRRIREVGREEGEWGEGSGALPRQHQQDDRPSWRRSFETAVEYGHLTSNPARGKRRRLRHSEPKRTYLQPDQAKDLLLAGREFDAESGDVGWRYPLLATLLLAGLRIGETLDLHWRDIDLSSGGLSVADSKTTAGIRRVTLTPALPGRCSRSTGRGPPGPSPRTSCSAPPRAAVSLRATSGIGLSLARSHARTRPVPIGVRLHSRASRRIRCGART